MDVNDSKLAIGLPFRIVVSQSLLMLLMNGDLLFQKEDHRAWEDTSIGR